MVSSQDTLPGMAPPAAEPIELARVLVDVDLPHLDHPLDYAVPPELLEAAQVGHTVNVNLAGRKHSGWILERLRAAPASSTIQPLLAVTSHAPMLTPAIARLARTIADKHVATMSQTLSLAIPERHVRAVKAALAAPAPQFPVVAAPSDEAWHGFPGGSALVRHLAAGESPRAVWTSLPGRRDAQLVSLVQACVASGRSAVVVVPTADHANRVHAQLSAQLDEPIAVLTSAQSAADRQRVHVEAILGHVRVVVGTRSAVWVPMERLGLLVVWDDGDDRLRERRAPRTDALEVAMARSHVESCAFVCGGWTRSVRAQAMVASGWAHEVVADLATRRALTPTVRVQDEADIEREGPAGRHRLPPLAMRLIRDNLEAGPVLIQVPFAGYVPVVACARCNAAARCAVCSGPLGRGEDEGRATCAWCGRSDEGWRCPTCHGTTLRATRVGSERTGEELGRAFPGVPLTVSSRDREVLRTIDARSRIVVATPGSEPVAEDGYAAALILDAGAIAGRPELWAVEEALRRWAGALVLARSNAPCLITGGVEPTVAQTLVRWDFPDFARRALDERESLGYFPAATVVAIDGPARDVREVARSSGGEILGTVPRGEDVRTLIRWHRDLAPEGLSELKSIQRRRSSRKLPQVKITVNPPELF